MVQALVGGLADLVVLVVVDLAMMNVYNKMASIIKEELKKGLKIELEQTDDVSIAKEIVKEYYLKDPQYYTKLNKIKSRRNR